MKTQTADEADARFLANIGVVLAAGTLAIGVVLVSSLPPSQNNVVAEATLPAVVAVADRQPSHWERSPVSKKPATLRQRGPKITV